jgi:deazaflavin-dependent oxidoreductase (nitroreductase family)
MTDMDDYNARVIQEFRSNGGVVGGQGTYVLLSTTGAKTGRPRTTPVVFQPGDNGVLYIFASKAGSPRHPDWYHNLLANPRVVIEQGNEKFEAMAAPVTGAKRDEIFARQVAAVPIFGEYQSKTDRVIPVVELRRV